MIVNYRVMAQKMYQAYGETTDFKNYQGLEMPQWKDLGPKIQLAWEKAAIAGHLFINRLYIEKED